MQISVIVPLFNEEESLPELFDWVKRVMSANNFSFEIIMVDDGSTDKSWEIIENLSKENSEVKGIKFRRNYGKSGALYCGFKEAQGDVVITMDADLQDSPDEIPELYKMITDEGFDLVSGWKKKRFDPFIKRNTSKIYNGISRMVTGLKLHDMNCGLKAYKLTVVKSIEVYGEMHRYIPVLANRAGYNKIGEKIVEHRERKYGVTKFGLERFMNGFLDLLSITFITKFGKRPMHFFGVLGVLMFFIGGLVTMWIVGVKVYHSWFSHTLNRDVTDQPLFYLALTTVIIGTQMFLGGFLGELISRTSADRNSYIIEKEI
jgi:glycosyltransferase involved in cell wall biosynthesis